MTRASLLTTVTTLAMLTAIADAAPEPYAALFQRGKHWTFAVAGVKHADGARVAHWQRELTCTVDAL